MVIRRFDPGSVAKLYGAHRAVVGTSRAVIIIDAEGVVRARHDHRFGLDFQSVDELREMLAATERVRVPMSVPIFRSRK